MLHVTCLTYVTQLVMGHVTCLTYVTQLVMGQSDLSYRPIVALGHVAGTVCDIVQLVTETRRQQLGQRCTIPFAPLSENLV